MAQLKSNYDYIVVAVLRDLCSSFMKQLPVRPLSVARQHQAVRVLTNMTGRLASLGILSYYS